MIDLQKNAHLSTIDVWFTRRPSSAAGAPLRLPQLTMAKIAAAFSDGLCIQISLYIATYSVFISVVFVLGVARC